MDSVESEGDSIDAAIEAALQMLQVPRERVEIQILNNAARGLFGIGSRRAKVRATLRSPISATPAVEAPAPRAEAPRAAEHPTPPAPSGGDRDAAERARTLLQQIIDLVGVSAGIEVRAEEDRILLELIGDSSGVLIGRRGQMLDALEYMLNRIIARDQGESARFVIDSQNYRARRREALEDLARRMGEQAKKKGRAVTLNPMSPRDRRIVHLVLQVDPSLSTKSSGKGYFRRLIIIPEGARRGARGDG